MFEISSTVGKVDDAFYYIFGVSIFFIVAIMTVMIYFLIRYHHKRNPVATDIEGNLWLEMTWSLIPLGLTMGMFYYGWLAFVHAREAAPGSTVITAKARKYSWLFEYENGKQMPELIAPAGRPVLLNLETEDVIHSFFLPAYKIKEDCIPGQTNFLTFTPFKEGIYDIYCTEYCGLGHSVMGTRIVVKSSKEYDLWYHSPQRQLPIDVNKAFAGFPEQLARGKTVYETYCASCHGLQGQGGLVANSRSFQSAQGFTQGSKVSQIFRTITAGLNEDMPSFAHLAADDRLAVIQYVRNFASGNPMDTEEDKAALDEAFSLSKGSDAPPEIPIDEAMRKLDNESRWSAPEPAPALNAREYESLAEQYPLGAQIYASRCARCHGARGEGDIPVAALDEIFRSRLLSTALNKPNRPWRGQGAPAFRERSQDVAAALGGVKPNFSTLTQEEWESLYLFAMGLTPER